MDIICKKIANAMIYAYHRGRFWRWDPSRSVWKESHLMTAKFQRAKAALRTLTPESFFSDSGEFALLDNYEISLDMTEALANAKPCQSAPVDPVEETPDTPDPAGDPLPAPAAPEGTSPVTETDGAVPSTISAPAFESPAAPGFDFGADERTNALLLQDAQTFITGNMARIMAAKHAHDLTASHYKGSWGKWCAAVGISRDTGENMVRVAEQFGNIQLEGKSILDVQPMKLLYAAAKPSTPEVVKQAVFTGDITTYKEYQDLLAQIKSKDAQLEAAHADISGLKDRATAAEAREEEAWSMVSKAQDEAKAAQENLDYEVSQNDALHEEKGQLLRECEAAKQARAEAEARAQEAEKQLEGSRQVAEAAKLRADKLQAENAALKKQPITAVIDEEEIDRLAAEKAWGLADARNAELAKDNANLKKQVAALRSRINDDAQADFEQANYCASLMRAAWDNSKASYSRLVGEDLESTFQTICGTLNSIMEEASLLCRQPPDYDGGDRDE